ncbi:phenylacetic acid degradation protein PaaN [Amphritea balenae]|uniref:Phenylacetic acid degradation protein PaaN n=1 Tax=Amphritea balenae TaxID=452629 RepID=A0A3P1SLV8_9GAMM|nr:phenylacetic acid degradation protein PaaN [Amphritea balenae]RRC97706.1 phenylacetic acid degradation protein PaaN [Amphritea balenae]RRC97990.1 phenylacetic acid degradation protein PaaN [Amphritea balenae]GGK82335.1 phenylacetic acid degradation protein PaaN [Amphritea balenae]
MSQSLFEQHQDTLQGALKAIRTRDYWSPYPESPSPRKYGETADKDGQAAFKAHLNGSFELKMPGITGEAGSEVSPYGFDLGVKYPTVDIDVLLPAMKDAQKAWRDIGVDARAGICLEILKRINARSFEIGYGVMHTSGQGFMMAFQAGGPHAQDRGLEAVAYGYEAMTSAPGAATWTKPQGKHDPLVLDKKFTVVGRGVGLVIGCSTFPTWNTYPGMFASLVTGNPVVVKPHPAGILPAAISIQIAQEVLEEQGLPPHIVSMVIDADPAQPCTKELAQHAAVKLIDFTGNTAFGDWLEQNCPQAQVYTEKAGVNTIIVDSTDNFKGMIQNLSFTLSLYSGQMCTTPQDIFIPAGGIETDQGHKSFDDVASALATGLDKFLSDPERAGMVLGCIQAEVTDKRIDNAKALGTVVRDSDRPVNPWFKEARMRSPLILSIDADKEDTYMEELFGPITFLIKTDSTNHSVELAHKAVSNHGAITMGCYTTTDAVLDQIEEAALDCGVALSSNLTGGVFVNQSAAFSDFHATGCNPAANACLSDLAYVANRFRVIQSRKHA